MSKILKDSTYNELKTRADAFDRILASIDGVDETESIDEHANAIIAALELEPRASQEDADQVAQLQTELSQAQEQITDLQSQLSEANTLAQTLQAELDEVPGEAPATIASKGEPTGKEQSLAEFADANAGNTEAILARLQAEGLL